jgi:cyclase
MRTRIIPTLLLKNESLVKTTKFNNFNYIGDPCNTIRIFNELEVDELMLLDITASKEGKEPNYSLLKDIASECFMPLSYGGAVRSVEQARKIFNIGFEKICINSAAFDDIDMSFQLFHKNLALKQL